MKTLFSLNIAIFIIAMIFLLNDQCNANPMHSALVGFLKKETCLPEMKKCGIYGNYRDTYLYHFNYFS